MDNSNSQLSPLSDPTIQIQHRRKQGIALSAIIVAGIAFFIGWMPFFGLIMGGSAVVLAVIALLKKQSKALSITALTLGALAAVTSIVITAIAFSTTDWNQVSAETSLRSNEQNANEKIETPAPKPSKSPAPEKNPEPEPTKKPDPKPSETPSPEPATNATSGGMTAGMAEVACENAAKQTIPGSIDFHWWGGSLAQTLENDAWFMKVEITPKGQARMVMECTVTGSESAPQLLNLDIY